MIIKSVLESFAINPESCKITIVSGGLINRTWKVIHGDREYILQRVNDAVFKEPLKIAENIRRISEYLASHHPDYQFICPLSDTSGNTLIHNPDGYFRLLPFVKNSVTIDAVSQPGQAFEAARQFGLFTKLLSGFEANTLHTTIPDFHNLVLRYEQFQKALSEGNSARKKETSAAIGMLNDYQWIVNDFEEITKKEEFRIRVTHHDTKISNVLFDPQGKGICVIDLDTVMPGYFISDLGDMIRTYVSPASEEEADFTRIEVREDVFISLLQGYLQFMAEELTDTEKRYIYYSGMFMTYMQALRFLADYLNNDVYYGCQYQGQNRVRAENQIHLLRALSDKEKDLSNRISGLLNH
jgi:thiamine kinase-like enzyme